jgi:glycosyl transferase, family 25
MREIIDYFERSYIINLKDRSDRRRLAEREFHKIGITIPNNKIQFYTAIRPIDKGVFQDIGTRGCFTSHKNILEIAHRDGLQNVLVFEDDVSFRSAGNAFGRQLISQLRHEDWDLAFFGYNSPLDEDLTGPWMRWQGDILGAHFFAVNGRFIGPMLQYMNECEGRPRDHPDGGPMPADGAYNHVRYVDPNIRLLLSVPSLAFQRSSRTDIAKMRFFDRVLWLRPIVGAARAIKHELRMKKDRQRLSSRLNK